MSRTSPESPHRSLVRWVGPRRRWTGVLVGLAAGIKLTPLFFVAFLLVAGRRRAATTAAVTFCATVALGALVAPRQSWEYWSQVLWDAGRVGGLAYSGNQSVMGVLTRTLGHEPATVTWLVVASASALLALAVAVLVGRSASPAARPLSLSLAALGMLLASPVSWSHHWVWLVPLSLSLWASRLPWTRAMAASVAAVALTWVIWWPPAAGEQELAWAGWEVVAGNAYVITAVAVLVTATAVARTGGQVRAADSGRHDGEVRVARLEDGEEAGQH